MLGFKVFNFHIFFAWASFLPTIAVWNDANHYGHHLDSVSEARRKAGIDSLEFENAALTSGVSGVGVSGVGSSGVVCGPCVEG